MTQYAQETNVTLTATPKDIMLGSNLRDIWVNIANNSIQGSATGTTVTVYPNGASPGTSIAYGSQESFVVGPVTWLRIAGNGANVTYDINSARIDIRSILVPAVTASIAGTVDTNTKQTGGTAVPAGGLSQNPNVTQAGVTSYGRAIGQFGTGSGGTATGATYTTVADVTNNSGSGLVYYIPTMTWRLTSATAGITYGIQVQKTLNADSTARPIVKIGGTLPSSGTIANDGAIGLDAGISGAAPNTVPFVSVNLPDGIVLLAGETLYVQAWTSAAGTIYFSGDYFTEPL